MTPYDNYTDLELGMAVLHSLKRRKALLMAAEALDGLNLTPVTITFPADPVAVARAAARVAQLDQDAGSSDGEQDV